MALTSKCTCSVELVQCISAQRIKIVLKELSAFTNDNTKQQLMPISQIDDNYTIIQLLNDYNHIKHDHNVDNDDNEFDKIYEFFKQAINTPCSVAKCGYVERYYMDRSKLSNEYNFHNKNIDNDNKLKLYCIMNIISKIHVYFMHSYDINRLKPD
eukprot:523210_1